MLQKWERKKLIYQNNFANETRFGCDDVVLAFPKEKLAKPLELFFKIEETISNCPYFEFFARETNICGNGVRARLQMGPNAEVIYLSTLFEEFFIFEEGHVLPVTGTYFQLALKPVTLLLK